jgi:RNA polymerase sigma-70 factor (ECF subfamily)
MEDSTPFQTATQAADCCTPEDVALVQALRAGDEAAFRALVEQHQVALLRLARLYVHDAAVAEEVVQETWLGVLRGIDAFQQRASLKTWIFSILVNRAKTIARKEGRTIPFSAAFDAESDPAEPALDPDRFLKQPEHGEPAGWWATPPREWDAPEATLLARETRDRVNAAIAALPPNQREVITLRDVEGWSSGEVCNVLQITETNQRVLLHRARSRVRQALDAYFRQEPA